VKKKSKPFRLGPKAKKIITYPILFLVTLGLCARPLAKGALFYQSYWGGPVFVPVILFVAALILLVAILNWNRK
jgi:hypothetical protein